MPDYGVQDDGSFEKKPIDVIRDDVKQQFKNELGQDIELRPSSPIVQIINAVSIEISNQWNAAEAAYYASFYEDSFGNSLEKHLAIAGVQRLSQRGATGEVTFSRNTSATQDVEIPQGTVVQAPDTQTRPAIPFQTTETVVIEEGSNQVTGVSIEALDPWEADVEEQWLGEETNLDADQITEFQNPISGVDSVTNPNPTGDTTLGYVEGRDEESDAEFRNRYAAAPAQSGDATLDAIRAELVNADDDIDSVKVTEIHDTSNDDYGVQVTVLAPGVTDDTVAQAIYDSMAGGLESYGSTSGTAEASNGDTYTENFDRASPTDVAVEITLTTDSTFPSDGHTLVEDALIEYIGGVVSTGDEYAGLGVGENVIYDQVFSRIMNVQGVVEIDLSLGETGGTLNTDNVPVDDLSSAVIDAADITFN